MLDNENTFIVRAYSQKELRNLYGVSPETWASWLAPIKEKVGDYLGKSYDPSQVEIIISHLGLPTKRVSF